MLSVSSNPYQSPVEPSVVTTGPIAKDRLPLFGPAIGLIVVSVAWTLLSLSGIVYFVTIFDETAAGSRGFPPTSYIAYLAISIAYSLMLVSGSFSMVRRGSYVWAVATSILAMVPLLGPCYGLSIPFGIWALVVLRRPAVRDSFRRA